MYEEFSEQVWGNWPERGTPLKALVVNPLGNWWSYAFTIEGALRLAEEGHEVHVLDLAPRRRGALEVNPSDRRSGWRFRDPRQHIANLLRGMGVRWVDGPSVPREEVASWTPDSLEELRRWQLDDKPSGKIVAAAISGVLQERDFDPQEHRELVELHIAAYEAGSTVVGRCLDELAPDMVVTTNDRLLNAALALSEARARAINSLVLYWGDTDQKCVTYAHSLYSADDWRSHIQGAWDAPASSQRYLKPAEDVLRAAAQKGLPSTAEFRMSMVGSDLPELPRGKKTIAFFPTTPWEYSGLVTRPHGYFEDQVEAVEALLQQMDSDEWVLVVRHHPPRAGLRARPEPAVWERVRGHPSLIEIDAESGVDSYTLMDASTVVAVWVSTIGAEAIARGKPVMVMGEPYWLNHQWGISTPTPDHVGALLKQPRSVAPEALLPYLCYFQSYGSPLRHVSGRGPETLRIHGDRVFPRTIAGAVLGALTRMRQT